MFTWNLFNLETEYLAMKPLIVENGRPVEMERRHFPWNHPMQDMFSYHKIRSMKLIVTLLFESRIEDSTDG